MQKHKIDGALNQNTNSNHNFKTNQIRTKKKKKKSKADPSELQQGGHAMVGGGKRGPSDPFVCVRERERERERASGMIWSRRSDREKKKKEK